jgi:hypothetical protein
MMLLVDWTIRVSAILGIALLAVFMLRHQSAALRHAILTVSVACAVTIPLLHVILPAWDVDATRLPVLASLKAPAEPQSRPDVPFAFNVEALAPPARTESPVFIDTPPVPEDNPHAAESSSANNLPADSNVVGLSAAPSPLTLERFVTFVWAGGVVIGLSLLIFGTLRIAWISSRCQPVSGTWARIAGEVIRNYELRCPLRIFRSSHTSILSTWGTLRPEILLPANSEEWPEDRIRVVLAHEIAHIKRNDWLIQVIAGVLRVIHWFNPIVWILYCRLRQESEQACDDTVIARGIAGPEYSAHLLAVARTLNTTRPVWTPGLLMAAVDTPKKNLSQPGSPIESLQPYMEVDYIHCGFGLLSGAPRRHDARCRTRTYCCTGSRRPSKHFSNYPKSVGSADLNNGWRVPLCRHRCDSSACGAIFTAGYVGHRRGNRCQTGHKPTHRRRDG